MNPITNPVVNSKVADKHFDDVRNQHTDILNGMRDQSLRVTIYNASKEEERNQRMIQQNQMNSDNQIKQEEVQNARMELQNKQQELEIKRQALMQ